MPTPIKLLSLDIDGTLYTPKGSVYDARKLAQLQALVKKLRSKGIMPIICTGKTASYAEAFAEAYGLVGGKSSHICEHGAAIFVYDTWQERQYIDVGKLYATKDYSDLQKVADAIIKQTGAKKDDKTKSMAILAKEVTEELYKKTLSVIRSLGYSVQTESNAGVVREFFALATAVKKDEEIKAAMQKHGVDFYASLSPLAINITPFPINKAFGVAYVAAKIHKCGLENVVAIGDDMGDTPLFDIVGLPIAVANADNETKKFVKAKGGLITKKKSLDGVMDVMRLLLKCKTIEETKEKFL